MASLTTTEARDNLAEAVNRVSYGQERIILTRRDRPIVAIVPLEDVELLEALENIIDIEAAREALSEPGATSLVEVKKELDLE